MKPEQIQVGRSYLLTTRYVIAKPVVRKVERIEDGQVITRNPLGKEVALPLRVFADMARREVTT